MSHLVRVTVQVAEIPGHFAPKSFSGDVVLDEAVALALLADQLEEKVRERLAAKERELRLARAADLIERGRNLAQKGDFSRARVALLDSLHLADTETARVALTELDLLAAVKDDDLRAAARAAEALARAEEEKRAKAEEAQAQQRRETLLALQEAAAAKAEAEKLRAERDDLAQRLAVAPHPWNCVCEKCVPPGGPEKKAKE